MDAGQVSQRRHATRAVLVDAVGVDDGCGLLRFWVSTGAFLDACYTTNIVRNVGTYRPHASDVIPPLLV